MQKRRHLETTSQLTDPGCCSDTQPYEFLLHGPVLPGASWAASWPKEEEQTLFTLQQIDMIYGCS